MATFTYKAARPSGATLDGLIDGDDERAVQSKLERDGYIVLALQSREKKASARSGAIRFGGKLPLHEVLVFNQELVALLKAGLAVLRIWDLLIERTSQANFKQALRTVREDIRGGSAMSEAMSKHPQYFNELYVATIRAGEQSGNLPEVLQRYIGYLKLMMELKAKVTKALAYPAFLVIVGVGVIGFLVGYVMPTFVSVYGESSQALPFATQALLDLISGTNRYFIPGLVALVGAIVGLKAYRATEAGRLTTDRLLLSAPGLGVILTYHHTIQLMRTLGTVLAGGIPAVEAVQIAGGAVSNRYMAKGLAEAVERIREGTTLASAIEAQQVLPKLATEMIAVGEETGSLETMLRDIAEFYEGSLDLKLTRMTTWIEPVLLLAMGFIVGAIVIIMYLPVFQMAGTVQ
jgi:type IV pilus assembly protein PilC